MKSIRKIIVSLGFCLAAVLTVRYVHSSELWQRAVILTVGLQWWPNVEVAGAAGLFAEGFFTALLAATFTTLLSSSAKLPPVIAAAVLSVAVFVGINDIPLFTEIDTVSAAFLTGYVRLALVFFLSGWLVAALAMGRIRKRESASEKGPE
jgi:hypothetical protein